MVNRALRRVRTALLFALACAWSATACAHADPLQLAPGAAPVVYVRLSSGELTVHTWKRSDVQIDGDPGVSANRIPAAAVERRLPRQLMLWSQHVDAPDGQPLQQPAEPFPFPALDAAPHGGVLVRGSGNATITVPADTALLVTSVGRGSIAIDGYHGGTFAALLGGGRIVLDDVSGTGAVQSNNGTVVVRNSSFDRLRARTARGSMFFERCSAAQIEATSLLGTIVYDDGTFTPGLAHFESQRGDIALGVDGDAQINAHSDAGNIVNAPEVPMRRAGNDAQAAYARSGPVVTATSGRGSVILYRGSLRAHPQLQQRFNIRRGPLFAHPLRVRRVPRGGGGRP